MVRVRTRPSIFRVGLAPGRLFEIRGVSGHYLPKGVPLHPDICNAKPAADGGTFKRRFSADAIAGNGGVPECTDGQVVFIVSFDPGLVGSLPDFGHYRLLVDTNTYRGRNHDV